MEEIAAAGGANPFSRADVMLPQRTEKLPAGEGWVYELKYDGDRVLAFSEGGRTVLRTRNGLDCTQSFSLAAEGVGGLLKGRAAVLDGEMTVAGGNGFSDFGALRAYQRKGGEGLRYVLFDLLALDGTDLRGRPLSERKRKLKALLRDAPPVLKYSEHTDRLTARECETLKARGAEGVVIKRADAPYSAGKNGDWLKLKFRNRAEFLIGGYTQAEAGGLGALLVGCYEKDSLRYAGKVGSGFSEETKAELLRRLRPLVRESSPFAVQKALPKDAVWVEPKLAAETEFAEVTAAGLLRQASFQGLRDDKAPRQIVGEFPPPAKRKPRAKEGPRTETRFLGIAVTHPEKVMYEKEGLTKGDLAAYYAAAAPRMLPYLKGRTLSLVCCPDGIAGEKFFRRHLDSAFEGVSETEDGPFLKSEKGVVALAQYNAVEFHAQGAKTGARPDVMVFDLDPDEGLPLAKVRRGARELKKTLGELGLVSFLKTSGGKGYHIVVPFRTGTDGEKFKAFAKRIALLLEERFPQDFTANMSKQKRAGKIFLDWQRNSRGATSVAPYSLRARAGAPVSMPIAWEELSRVAPNGITLKTARKRLEKPDPWANFFEVKQKQSLKG